MWRFAPPAPAPPPSSRTRKFRVFRTALTCAVHHLRSPPNLAACHPLTSKDIFRLRRCLHKHKTTKPPPLPLLLPSCRSSRYRARSVFSGSSAFRPSSRHLPSSMPGRTTNTKARAPGMLARQTNTKAAAPGMPARQTNTKTGAPGSAARERPRRAGAAYTNSATKSGAVATPTATNTKQARGSKNPPPLR